MKIRCPYCAESFDLEAYLKDRVMVEVIKMLPDFGPHARLAWEYAELFRLGPPLNAKKLARVLGEVREFFHGGGFDYQKKRYDISRDGLAAALRTVCNARIKGGLTNHNYLKKCAIPIAEEEAERRSRENERRIREAERGLRNEVRPGVEGNPAAAGGAGNLGPLIRSFVAGLEGGPGAQAERFDPTDRDAEAARALDRARGVMRPEREP